MMHNNIAVARNLLRFAYGAVVLLAGLDKLLGTNLIVEWAMYVSPAAMEVLPVSVGVFLAVVGIIEVAVGAALLWGFKVRLVAYAAAAWLVIISINLLALGYVDIAIRDVLLAVGAVALGQLAGTQTATE